MSPQINLSIHLYVVAAAFIAPLCYASAKVQQRYIGKTPRTFPGLLLIGVAALSAAMVERDAAMLASALVLGAGLVTLAVIDLHIYRLPDPLTFGLTAAGLASAILWHREDLPDRLIGAVVGYAALAGAAWAYLRLRGRHGLGLGDAKLLAAAGAWLGWRDLPIVLLMAALAGLAWTAMLAIHRKERPDAAKPLPFGPWLAAAIWICRLTQDAVAGRDP